MRFIPMLPFLLTGALTATSAFALTPAHRLGHEAVPTSESVTLHLDPAQKSYRGSVTIALRVSAATDSFQLHALGLGITRLALTSGKRSIPVTHSSDAEHGVLTVRSARRLAPGAYSLAIAFTNDFDTHASGLYRLEAGGDSYAFTQFEAAAAREAFPCWDEPEFKIPWAITLVVPKANLALSNAPIAAETPVGAERRVVFERTPPLPSYLIALATGPLETVAIPGVGIPARVVTVRGKSNLAAYAVQMTPPILTALEGYFGTGYPFKKLDLIAVPEFWAGAMENPGAITYREEALLLDPAGASANQRRRLVIYTAHELAHMWFGDLVTMKWWDDFWLNESFASWMEVKITQQVAPEFGVAIDEVQGTMRAMVTDARPSTRAIRQPVDGFDNLDDLADVLAYQKGQAVLGMIEQWLGPEVVQKGVRAYLATHAWKNATGADLWNALSEAAGHDVAAVVTSFLDQPGVPIVEVEPDGAGGVRLRQHRFQNSGVAASGTPQLWRIPMTLRYSFGSAIRTKTVLLTEAEQTVALDSPSPLAWLHPNADERGYYRWSLPSGPLTALAELPPGQLGARERMGFVGNAGALLDAGALHGDETLQLLGRFGNDADPVVVGAVIDALDRVRFALITPELRSAFAVYVRRTLGPAYDRIHPEKQAGESEAASLLRPRLMNWLGGHGDDPAVLARARTWAEAYLADPKTVDPAMVGPSLQLAALGGDAALFERYRGRFESATLPVDRDRFLPAMASFRDTALVARALAYGISGPIRPQEIFSLMRGVGARPENHDRLVDWVRSNYGTLTARMPPSVASSLAFAFGGCSAERLELAKDFFAAPDHHPPGIAEALAKVSDSVHDCIGLREREGSAVARYLQGLAAAR